MTRLHYLLTLLLLLQFSTAQEIGEIEKSDCFLTDCSTVKDYPNIVFGYITVPENYDKPEGRKLKVAFSIIKSTVENPKSDPILIFQGGWGLPILNSIHLYAKNYPIKDRDLILYDYRGSGYSEPQMCDSLGLKAWNDLADDISHIEFQQNQTRRFNNCLDDLEERGIDIQQYGSNNKTRDAILLAENLGYESYNLFGISYGTRSILNFLRNAENSNLKIRSAILDSNSPIGLRHQGRMTEVYENVLLNILNDCSENPECEKAFPNLKERFISFLKSLDENPWIVELDAENTFTFNKEEINAHLHQILYKRNLYKSFPIQLEQIIARDEKSLGFQLKLSEDLVKIGYNALGAINFVYDHKHFQKEAAERYRKNISKNNPFEVLDGYMGFYMQDRRMKGDSLDLIPPKSDIPALFLAGTYDPITPPSWTKFVHSHFSNGQYLEAIRIGHGVSPNSSCGGAIMQQFFDDPNSEVSSQRLDELGENRIDFITDYYKNSNIGYLANGLFQNFNFFLIVLLIIVIIVFFINLFKLRKQPLLSLLSFLIIGFITGLILMIKNTVDFDRMLILFGLVDSAKVLMMITPIILILSAIYFFNYFKGKKTTWNSITVIALILFTGIVINYQLFPNI